MSNQRYTPEFKEKAVRQAHGARLRESWSACPTGQGSDQVLPIASTATVHVRASTLTCRVWRDIGCLALPPPKLPAAPCRWIPLKRCVCLLMLRCKF